MLITHNTGALMVILKRISSTSLKDRKGMRKCIVCGANVDFVARFLFLILLN